MCQLRNGSSIPTQTPPSPTPQLTLLLWGLTGSERAQEGSVWVSGLMFRKVEEEREA